jgi:tRNA(Ile)-lysidine synthase
LRRTFSSSSSGGLRGIPASRNLRDGILALRPMLGISRREIDAYILEKKLVVSEDSSNAEDTYQRNKIRKTLKPALGRVFPGWEKGLLGTSSRIAIDGDFVDAASKEAAHKVLSPYKNGFRIPIDNYNSLHRAIRLRLLSQACASCSGRVIPSWRSILEFDKAIFSGSPRIQSAGISIERYDGALIIAPSLDFNAHRRYFFLISKPGIYRNGGYSAVFEKFIPLGATEDSRNAISKNAFVFPFALRTRKPGDQILVDGHSILVDDILKDWKVAPSVRDIVPILEDYNGIFAIMPICLDGYGLLHRKFRSFEGSLGEEGISLILKGVR